MNAFGWRGSKAGATKRLSKVNTAALDRSLTTLRIRACTWNVGNAVPARDLSSWLDADGDYHIIVVGAQESTYGATSKVDAMYKTAAIIQETATDKTSYMVAQTATMMKFPSLSEDAAQGAPKHLFKSTYQHMKRTCLACGKTIMLTSCLSCTQCKKCVHRACLPNAPKECAVTADASTLLGPGGDVHDQGAPSGGDAPGAADEGGDATADWLMTIQRHLGKYKLIETSTLMEIRIAVFASEELLSKYNVHNIRKGSEATGLGRIVGNKGGAAVSFRVGGKTLAFVAAHLAAHEGAKHLQTRNADVREILRNLSANSDVDYQYTPDHLFWIGDLNYRNNPALTNPAAATWTHDQKWDAVSALVEAKDYAVLLANDELRHEMQTSAVFTNFQEGDITFSPTFKVERSPGLHYLRQRVPSYCDRILWHSLPSLRDRVACLEYQAAPDIPTSDHKPVYATFMLDLKGDRPDHGDADPSLRGALLRITSLDIEFPLTPDTTGDMDAAAEAEARIMTGDADVIRDRVNEIEKQLEDTQAETPEGALLQKESDLLKKELELMDLEDRLLERLAEAKHASANDDPAASASKARRQSVAPRTDHSVHLSYHVDKFSVLEPRVMKQRLVPGDNMITLHYDASDLVPLTCLADVKAPQLYDKHLFIQLCVYKKKGILAENIGQCAVPLRECVTKSHGETIQFTSVLTKYSTKRATVRGEAVLLLPDASGGESQRD